MFSSFNPYLVILSLQGVYDNPEFFYGHVSSHADVYADGNKPPGGCKCLWEGIHQVKTKDYLKLRHPAA